MYQLTDIAAQVYEAGASPREIEVQVLDLHETGGRFVLRGYLHPGTRIDITLPTLAIGENIETSGVVGTCSHHSGMDHVVTVQFNESIDLAAVTAVIASSKDEDAGKEATRELSVLLIDAIELDRAVLAQRLPPFSLRVTGVGHLGAGVDQIKVHHFDAILLDDAVEDVSTPEEAIAILRETGYTGPIIVSTDRVSIRYAQHMREQGANVVLVRPASFQLIGRIIRAVCTGEQISELPQILESDLFDAACEGAIVSELSRLQKLVRCRRVEPKLRTSLRAMATVGATFGLTLLGRASGHLLRSLEQTETLDEEIAAEMEELIRKTAGALRKAA